MPQQYLADYYRVVEPDERATIAYFADAMKDATAGEAVLVFGTGPTLHHVFLAAPKASEIHLADYLPANLEEIERWRTRDPAAHDWRAFVRYTLECEGLTAPTDADITRREELTRSKITRLLQADARHPVVLDQRYATVISAYCADSATDDRATWETLMANITGLVGPGGLFITAALRRCRSYLVGDKRFPSANVDEHDLRRVLAPGFSARVQVRDLQGHEAQGYSSIVLADARRRTRDPSHAAPRSGPLLSGGYRACPWQRVEDPGLHCRGQDQISPVGRILLGEPPVTPVNTRNPACPTLPGSRGVPSAGAEFLASRPTPDRELVALVLAARAGDSAAWTELLGRFDRTLRSIAGSCRLAPADVDDVVQATWLDLLPGNQHDGG